MRNSTYNAVPDEPYSQTQPAMPTRRLAIIIISLAVSVLLAIILLGLPGCGEDSDQSSSDSNVQVTEASIGGEIALPDDLEDAVHDAIMMGEAEYFDGEFSCESHAVLALVETDAASADSEEADEDASQNIVDVFAWVLIQSYDFPDGAVQNVSSNLIPTNLTFTVADDGSYDLYEYWTARDETYFQIDIEERFGAISNNLVTNALDSEPYIDELTQACYAEALAYAGLDPDDQIAQHISAIASSTDIAPGAEAAMVEYEIDTRDLISGGMDTLRYIATQFMQGGQDGPEGLVMAAVMEELVGDESFDINAADYKSGQDYFEAWYAAAADVFDKQGLDYLRENYPISYRFITQDWSD